MKLIVKVLLLSFILSVFNSSILNAQAISATVPTGGAAENDPFANSFQKWTPMMQKLFQQLKNNKNYIEHDIGADIGSAYVYEDFRPGKIYYNDELLGDVYYRFNAYNNEIELKSTQLKEEKQKALIKDENIRLVGNDINLKYTSFITDKDKSENGYLNLIFENEDYSVYEHFVITYKEGKPAANSMVNPIPSKFTNYVEFYFQENDNNSIKELSQKKNKFINQFDASLAGELKSLIKSENLDLKNKKDILRVFTAIENLNL